MLMKGNSKSDNPSFYASGGWFIRSAEGNRATTRIFNDQEVARTTKDVLADLKRMKEARK
jgi:hypothetical protein